MWIDGVQHKNKQDNQYKEASSVLIPPNSRVIAVQCQDVGGKEGLIGSTSTGIMTGQAGWVCTAREQRDWQLEEFDDSDWVTPDILGENGAPGFPFMDDIDINATWVWTEHMKGVEAAIWCRYHLGSQP